MKMDSEQITLAAFLVLLTAGGVGAAFLFKEIQTETKTRTVNNVAPFDPAPYSKLADNLVIKHTVTDKGTANHRIFVSRMLKYTPSKDEVGPLDPKEVIGGLPLEWREQYGRSLTDPDVAFSDPDGDGFTDLDEFTAKTDPNDPASSPPKISKLRMESFKSEPFKILFKGYSTEASGHNVYQIQIDGSRKTLLVKEGQFINIEKKDVADSGWKIGKFRQKIESQINPATNIAEKIDVSELDLEHPRIPGEVIVLVRNKTAESLESEASFLALIPNEPAIPAVLRGNRFKFNNEEFTLKTPTADHAVIVNSKTKEELKVPKVTSEELENLKKMMEVTELMKQRMAKEKPQAENL